MVGAVPMCPPVSPCKGASIVSGAFHGWEHGVCTWKCIIRRWKRNVYGWQHLILVWKRRYADVRAGTQAPPLRFHLGGLRVAVDTVWVDYVWDGWFRLGGLCANGHFICVGLRGKILRSVVGAVPVCPPVSPHKGASVVKYPAHNACVFGMETPRCGRLDGLRV